MEIHQLEYLVALAEELHWSRSLVAGAFAVFAVVHGLSSPPLGWLADRVGPRRVFMTGGAVLALQSDDRDRRRPGCRFGHCDVARVLGALDDQALDRSARAGDHLVACGEQLRRDQPADRTHPDDRHPHVPTV